jgi:hypothetical protein
MSNEMGMTNEQRNKQHLQEMAEKSAKRQQESLERHNAIANGFGNTMAKDYNLSEMTATANGLLSGELNAKNFDAEKAILFTNQCNTAIKELNKNLQHTKTSAGLAYMQNRLDSYKKLQQEIDDAEGKIALFKNFI